ncbi:hypothetical protein JQC72_14945 [Polycladomyces sp. WAk]|uniref:Uncharacterized protein n=1 Tax=Polycladomyces zharkentensis TaxID=2807616 RepID=A0ABS2WMM8_9BACL|nr:hypothetical protein [Polycladomyces sp. WAk]MBN2910795.1 hypothetical protein [Polycladomyces sp. WAk]
MKYKAEYHFEGHFGMNYLNPGDVVELANGKRFRVLWTKKHGEELVYNTDTIGIIYARELKRIG